MKLSEYFQKTEGTGIMATADAEGRVDAAVYSKPYFLEEDEVAFLTTDKLTRHNLQDNPHAAFLFRENEAAGKRLYLTRIKEDQDSELTEEILRSLPDDIGSRYQDIPKYVLYFHVDEVKGLVGEKESV